MFFASHNFHIRIELVDFVWFRYFSYAILITSSMHKLWTLWYIITGIMLFCCAIICIEKRPSSVEKTGCPDETVLLHWPRLCKSEVQHVKFENIPTIYTLYHRCGKWRSLKVDVYYIYISKRLPFNIFAKYYSVPVERVQTNYYLNISNMTLTSITTVSTYRV